MVQDKRRFNQQTHGSELWAMPMFHVWKAYLARECINSITKVIYPNGRRLTTRNAHSPQPISISTSESEATKDTKDGTRSTVTTAHWCENMCRHKSFGSLIAANFLYYFIQSVVHTRNNGHGVDYDNWRYWPQSMRTPHQCTTDPIADAAALSLTSFNENLLNYVRTTSRLSFAHRFELSNRWKQVTMVTYT